MYKGTTRTGVILGGSSSIWEDYDKVMKVRDTKDLIHFAVNDISFQFNKAPIDHIVSLHSEMVGALKSLHKVRFTHDACAHGYKDGEGVDCIWCGKLNNLGGTSSLFAVEIALELGITDIFVCGVTLDSRPHYYEDLRQEKGTFYDFGKVPEGSCWRSKFDGERAHQKKMVKVASGQLQEYFGGIDG